MTAAGHGQSRENWQENDRQTPIYYLWIGEAESSGRWA